MSRLSTLNTELEATKGSIQTIERAATEAGRDLTEAEEADTNKLVARATELTEQIKAEGARLDQAQDVAAIMARHASVAQDVERASGKEVDNLSEYIERATQGLADGLVPKQIVGGVISTYDAARPVFTSFAQRQFPEKGSTFERPKITQHVAVDQQDAEFDTLASQKMTWGTEVVYKRTAGGYIDLSEQAIDWNDPSAIEAVVQDFARVYANHTEADARAFIGRVASASAGWTATNVSTVTSSLIDAAVAAEAETFENADTVWIDRTTMANLAKLLNTTTDTSGLVLIKQALAEFGASFNFVVGRFAAPTLIVGSSKMIEAYEQYKGLIRVPRPEVLAERVAVRGYYGFYAVGTTQTGNQNSNVSQGAKGFRRLV